MKKKWLAGIIILVLVLGGFFAYNRFSNLDGQSIESREKILNQSLKKGKEWTLWNQVIFNNYQYQVSGAYSVNGKAAIVVFEQKNNGKRQFFLRINCF